ncbi:MAG: peptide deformylase [Halobacteriovorax sp.]|nr:peptide deformylase [Halobacteriovorax sp.]|tara:strand:+ start:309307 stop:309906 length:600 start_codon:yes stop_codon:yes gene_type:complete
MHELELGPDYILEGEGLKVFTFPAPILKKVAVEINSFDQELHKTVKDMLYTMYRAPGIGLAAPQVGLSIRLFCLDTEFERERVTNAEGIETFKYSNFDAEVFINPVITQREGEVVCQEGCLSFPGVFEDIKRSEKITVEYQNLDGEKRSTVAEGMRAICIQHELDHLDGIVFLEKLSPLKRALILKKFQKKKKKRGSVG